MDFLCLDFVNANSQWYATHEPFAGYLQSGEWARRFCLKWDLPLPETEKEIDMLATLRGFLYEAARELCASRTLSPSNLEKINEYLASAVFCERLERDDDGGRFRLDAQPQKSAASPVALAVVRSFAKLVAEHPVERIKLCANLDCGWIFYDESKSRTRKWCENACASLFKVRRFRARQKAGGAGAD